MLEKYTTDLKRWLKHPYNDDGSIISWFLFVGLWVAATMLWIRVIKRLVD